MQLELLFYLVAATARRPRRRLDRRLCAISDRIDERARAPPMKYKIVRFLRQIVQVLNFFRVNLGVHERPHGASDKLQMQSFESAALLERNSRLRPNRRGRSNRRRFGGAAA
jgi:hypothetical protein